MCHYAETIKEVLPTMCITTTSVIKDEPPNEFALADHLEDEYIMFLLQLEHTYSSQFELSFLSGSHNFGVVGTTASLMV